MGFDRTHRVGVQIHFEFHTVGAENVVNTWDKLFDTWQVASVYAAEAAKNTLSYITIIVRNHNKNGCE